MQWETPELDMNDPKFRRIDVERVPSIQLHIPKLGPTESS